MQRGIATLLAIALVLWAVVPHMFNVAEASNLTNLRDTLSDSDPGAASDHEFDFRTPTGVLAGGTIVVTFPNGFNIATSTVEVGDVDLLIDGVSQTLAAGAPGATEWGFSTSSQDVVFTAGGSESANANASITIRIGLNATGGNAQVTNPTATTSYEFTVTAGASDSGQMRVAIIDNVLVTANIDTTLTFTISGVGNGATVNGSPTTTFATSTSTTLPFGTLVEYVSKMLAQDLAVSTNARNGYVVTVEQDTQFQSITGADIDGIVDGNWIDSPTAWVPPTNDIDDENTWGHWGLTSTDGTTTRPAQFNTDLWVAASTTPTVIMAHTGPADGTTAGVGAARIGYQVQITALQEAGDDYNTTLTYIATPIF